ncbi:type II secretory protein pull [Pseudomonas kairouanensis]|uniref:Type II secretion system protein L n=1 Tax=Pseudomonas kairouanensis TaxID=2293832 RepID=A0A4Z0AU23_9PSED|nr:type II secretion system protein GspL [Pseudomonas kairouanensis]TFY89857.1 type II secretory protein pull [Pseudomonas kairouanensis]
MNTWLHLSAEGLATPSGQWPCCVRQAGVDSCQMALIDASLLLRGQKVDLLLPMEMCSGLRSEPWPSRRRPSAQAIAFAIEEQLGEELDGLHVCAGRRDAAGCYTVLVTHKARFKALLQLLASLGIDVCSVHVDADVLPADGHAAVSWQGRRVLGAPVRLALSESALKALEPLLGEPLQWLDDAQSREVIEQALWGQGPSINLLQGEFARTRQPWPWPTAALAAAMMFTLGWGFMQMRIQHVETQAQQLYAQSVEHFQALYPEQARIVDLAAQFKALQGTRAHSPETPLARLVSLTEQVVGGGDVNVERIEFRRGEGWKIQLTTHGFSELEQLRERGQLSGMPVRVGNASKEGSRVQAVLMLEDAS